MKLKKRILGLLLALSILIVPTTQVFAATPTFWCEFLGNIKNVTYYVSTSANSTYINQINLAISNWRSSSYLNNKPVLNKTSNVSSYALAYYTYSSGTDMNTLGITKHFTTGSHQVNPDSNNWNFAEVYINNSTINRTNYGRLNPPFKMCIRDRVSTAGKGRFSTRVTARAKAATGVFTGGALVCPPLLLMESSTSSWPFSQMPTTAVFSLTPGLSLIHIFIWHSEFDRVQ